MCGAISRDVKITRLTTTYSSILLLGSSRPLERERNTLHCQKEERKVSVSPRTMGSFGASGRHE